MTSTREQLIEDPIFQLNLMLWLTQPLPSGTTIEPLLFRRGYAIYAIAPMLPTPLDLHLAATQQNVEVQTGTRPDVVLENQAKKQLALVECKKNSSGPDSTTAAQTRTLLLAAGDRAGEFLGGAGSYSGVLAAIVLPKTSADRQRAALSTIKTEVATLGAGCGESSVVALANQDGSVGVVCDDTGQRFFDLPAGFNPAVKAAVETDPRPLYFIPYDPDVHQTDEERQYCKRVLYERLHCGVIVAIGRAIAPVNVTFRVDRLLNDAMFGMYAKWENKDSRRHLRKLCNQLLDSLRKVINERSPGTVKYDNNGTGWTWQLFDTAHRKTVIDVLQRFSCETMDLRAEPSARLFDEIEDDSQSVL